MKLVSSVVDQANSDDPSAPIFWPGAILNRVYEVKRVLGRGNIGIVYLCKHLVLRNRLMAVKVLDAEISLNRVARQRFVDEISATYEVSHPNVIRTFEYFEDNGVCGLAMEYIEGGDLFDLIEQSNPLSLELIRKLLLQVCAGLIAVHDKGIVHRDIKPENILVTTDLQAKIADFGIASLAGRARATVAGNLVGALDYLSPEYIQYGEFDRRSDLYAVGALAFKMITGRTPFEGLTLNDSLARRVSAESESVTRFRIDCPPDLAQVVAKALARNPAARYQSAAELACELEQTCKPVVRVPLQIKVRKPEPRPNSIHVSKARLLPESKLRCLSVCASWIMLFIALASENIVPGLTALTALPVLNVGAPQAADSEASYIHTVRFHGESLSIVAGWYTGNIDNWRKIADANPNLDPNLIAVGQKIIIPSNLRERTDLLPFEYVEKFQANKKL